MPKKHLTVDGASLARWLPLGDVWADLIKDGGIAPATIADYTKTLNAIASDLMSRGGLPGDDTLEEPDFSMENLKQWDQFIHRHREVLAARRGTILGKEKDYL